ncbi:hypothetical protein [Legionella cherrii]|uniref:Dot/Icm T4SS effector n=1 Tax=Legionella cherrii TaxID=28084 RepID=A0ABY6T9E1_9GAMM|nr:hypothetical protein [Legionella cherrii]VEB39004.1 Dot/Icm T4SS effector [Legionella cherrii]
MPYRINNPGGGDCGFFAFAIGAIKDIQDEYALYGKSATYDQWIRKGLLGVSLQELIDFDLNRLYESPYHYKNELLSTLQMSLRNIAADAYTIDLLNRIRTEAVSKDEETLIEGSPVYHKFMELVRFYLGKEKNNLAEISKFNELALSPQVTTLAENTARSLQPKLTAKPLSEAETNTIENAHVKEALLKDVMQGDRVNPGSVILKGVEKIKEQGRWATHGDLKEIAVQLNKNLYVEGQLNGDPDPRLRTIVLNNEDNAHWTTQIEQLPPKRQELKKEEAPSVAKEEEVISASVSKPINAEKADGYQQHVNDLIHAVSTQGLFSQVKNKINVEDIDTAEALKGESDEDFAKRLQEAEYRRAFK